MSAADSIFPSHIFTEFAASANSYAELLWWIYGERILYLTYIPTV